MTPIDKIIASIKRFEVLRKETKDKRVKLLLSHRINKRIKELELLRRTK